MENVQPSKESEEKIKNFITKTIILKFTQKKQDELNQQLSDALSEMPLDWQKITLLLHTGADVDIKNRYAHSTALILAAQEGKTELVRFLLDNDAAVDAKDKLGETALLGAVVNGHREVIVSLMGKNADTTIKNMAGKTPMQLAQHLERDDIAKLLQTHQALTELKEELKNSSGNVNERATQAASKITFKDFVDVYFSKT